MKLTCSAICDKGTVRSDNQDNLYCNRIYRKDIRSQAIFRYSDTVENSGLYAIADGMGGEANGADAALETVCHLGKLKFPVGMNDILSYLNDRNAAICDWIEKAGGQRMGSTFAGLYINGNSAEIVNIGDSRIYRMRSGKLEQLSRDHTVVQSMISIGIITKAEAKNHHDRHRLTQHLGIFPDELVIEPLAVKTSVEIGDLFMLCSDGLTEAIDENMIAEILEKSATISEKTEMLFSAAIQAGTKDNVTVIVVGVD